MGEVLKLGPRPGDDGAPARPKPGEKAPGTAAAGSLTLSAIPKRTLAIGGGVIAVLVAGGLIFAFTGRGGGGSADAAAPAVTSGAVSPGAIDGAAPAPTAAEPGMAGGYSAPDAGMVTGGTQSPAAPGPADSGLPPSHDMGSADPTAASVTDVDGGGAYGSGGEPLPPGTPLSPSDPGWDARSGSDLPGRPH